ncbi:MAG: hypothetical protein DRN11_04710 [Thermoplasmata archaeon]|nr:MAG: hypothetical protein DRN11_04710 [Thermoplasmata archaeon]
MDDEEIIKFIRQRLQQRELEEMNEELKKWVEEHGIKLEEKEEKEEKIEGKCEICEAREAKYRCIECGKIACLSCFWTLLGICKECLPEEKMKELKEKI